MREKIKKIIQTSYTDDAYRRIIIFHVLNLLLAVVALVMTIVNWHTKEYELMLVTGLFTFLCLANCAMLYWKPVKEELTFSVFSVEVVTILAYFVLGGIPQGFSVLWTLLVPSLGIAVFGKKMGIRLCALVFLMIIFFFWLPFGRSLLYYNYSETFMLRFPFVYLCLFVGSIYLEALRLGAYEKLQEMEKQAVYLYRHDALTGIYSRYAFTEELQQMLAHPTEKCAAIMILDVDDFKRFNDSYGHNAGDQILRTVSQAIQDHICEHCIPCRWGGEEFLVLMQCEHDPFRIAESIRKKVEQTAVVYQGKTLNVTLSVGIAVADSLRKECLDDFINCADNAMYISKEAGKNRTTLAVFRGKTEA